jgi:hypothetical protein
VGKTDPNNLISVLTAIGKSGFTNNNPGQNHKKDVMAALSNLVGGPVTPVSGSPLDALVDHSFFSLQQLVENKKLN